MRFVEADAAVESAFALGSPDAVALVYKRFGGLVYSFCLRSLPVDLAQDATQQVFVSAWRRQSTFDPRKGSLAAWLMGIAKNRVIDVARSEQRAQRGTDLQIQRVEPVNDPGVEQLAEQLVISDALAQMSDRSAKVLSMALYDELSHGEISERLSLPLGTVKSDIRRGLQNLRQVLERGQ